LAANSCTCSPLSTCYHSVYTKAQERGKTGKTVTKHHLKNSAWCHLDTKGSGSARNLQISMKSWLFTTSCSISLV